MPFLAGIADASAPPPGSGGGQDAKRRNRLQAGTVCVGMNILATLLLVGLTAAPPTPFAVPTAVPVEARFGPGRHELAITVDGWPRHAVVQVPSTVSLGGRLPVVLGLHGAGGDGAQLLDQNGWAAAAERGGFIAVAPDGLPVLPRLTPSFLLNPTVWNNGELPSNGRRGQIDDVAFVAALLNELNLHLAVDPRRVYVTGHSAGAGMTFMLAARLASRFAAIAPVASHCWLTDPRPSFPLPALYLIGTEDPLVPVDGGRRDLPWGPPQQMPPVSATLERWGRALGCAPGLPPLLDLRAGLAARQFRDCRARVPFSAWYIAGQGHGWPGGVSRLPPAIVGPSVATVDATAVIWEFFSQQVRP